MYSNIMDTFDIFQFSKTCLVLVVPGIDPRASGMLDKYLSLTFMPST